MSKEDIILINEMTIDRHGGNYVPPSNFHNEGPLDYLLQAVDSELFGEALYPEAYYKAGLYMFNIVSNHVFQDGNKRTGLGSALLFLKLNGFGLKSILTKIKVDDREIPLKGISTNEILIEFTLELASGKVTLSECQEWFKNNITEKQKD
ncbi:MAG: type II toxin-antitoxin system death-on-curing family toxin [Bacteroidota bacterium]